MTTPTHFAPPPVLPPPAPPPTLPAGPRLAVWHFFDPATGLFSGASYVGVDSDLPAQLALRPGLAAHEGAVDHLSQRRDLASGQLVDWQPPAPADTDLATHAWDAATRRWIATPTLQALRREAHDRIDAAAGAARLRYITDVPGQSAVYLAKLDEAHMLLANPNGTPGPHLAAEAAATGVTPAALAAQVEALGSAWLGTVSPAIEAARIGGKAAVTAAPDPAAVETALQAALSQLAPI